MGRAYVGNFGYDRHAGEAAAHHLPRPSGSRWPRHAGRGGSLVPQRHRDHARRQDPDRRRDLRTPLDRLRHRRRRHASTTAASSLDRGPLPGRHLPGRGRRGLGSRSLCRARPARAATADGSSAASRPASAAPMPACSAGTTVARCSYAPTRAAARPWGEKRDGRIEFDAGRRRRVPDCLDREERSGLQITSRTLALAGKVAIVTGGGAVGDGIGNGRAACILLARAGARVLVVDRELELAKRTVEMITGEGGTAAALAADVTDEGAVPRDGRSGARPTSGGSTSWTTTLASAARGSVVAEDPQTLAPAHASQRRHHVPDFQARDPRDDQDGQGRGDRQYRVDRGAAPARAHHLLRLQGCGHRADPGDGGRSRPRRDPRQLRGARAGVYAHGHRVRHERSSARAAPQGLRARRSRAPDGTSATPCASCSPIRPASSPDRLSWSMAAPRWSARLARPSRSRPSAQNLIVQPGLFACSLV